MSKHSTSAISVSSASISDLLQSCEHLALVAPDALLAHQLPTKDDPTRRVPERKLINLWEDIAQHTHAPETGLIIGSRINPSTKGILASWVSQCGTLREALSVFQQNIALMNPSEHWLIEENESYCELTFEIDTRKGYPIMAIERSMSALVAWGRILSGTGLAIKQACFAFDQPTYLSAYTPIFGEGLQFNYPKNTLRFDSHWLDTPITSANPLLKSMMENEAAKLIKTLDTHHPVSAKVKQLITDSLARQLVSSEQVSAAMSMSRQTLYRKLKQENTDFKTLLNEARKAKAAELLALGKENMLSISLSLGFKEPSSFYKAFKRWYGMPVKSFIAKKN